MTINIKDSKILIVDDIAENIQVLGNILDENGYQVSVAMSGEEAITSLETELPDLILLDINMPGMNGFDVSKKLKSDETLKEIPIIFLTANTELDKILEAFNSGAVDYITKPFQPEELLKRVQTHLELRKSKQQLEDIIKVKNKFFSIIAHDLKSPFNALIGFSNLLLTDTDITAEQKEAFIQVIHKTSKKGLGLLENLLLWSSAQTDQIDFRKENQNLNFICENVVQLLRLSAYQKEISIENLIPKDIEVCADSQSLETIFRNLLSNAIKFTNRKGGIVIQSVLKKDEVVVSINDNGMGMNKKIKSELFQLDKKNSSPGTENESGTGLGLVLVQDFVKKNGGEIWAESELDIGTTFYFSIPLSAN